jgi:uncharacterized NAD-dependent epimerase/dehydratase family protein
MTISDLQAGEAANEPNRQFADKLSLPQPYLLFLGDGGDASVAKTAYGLAEWARDRCIGEWVIGDGSLTTGLPHMSPIEARTRGARSLVIGVANRGGFVEEAWITALVGAMEAGLDLVSGLHVRLTHIPILVETALRTGRRLIDIRVPPSDIAIGTGRRRSGKRLLTVGTDCALGKKYTALALHRSFVARGLDADFRATGQTGIMIAGGGIPMDAVVSDFEAGAAETLSPDAPDHHWDLIEGQGSLFHPSYAAVSLGLLHGSQPDVFVVCHDPTRKSVIGLDDFVLPSIEDVIDLTIRLGSRTNPGIRCGGVSFNTSSYESGKAAAMMEAESARIGLPVADPIRGGKAYEALIDYCLA